MATPGMLHTIKISRGLFALISVIVNAANAYLVPQIPIPYFVFFTTTVLNAVLVYLATQVVDLSELTKANR
jgi:hypothetical protein